MSTDDTNTPVESTDVDLDTFSTEFFGQDKVDEEPASSDVEEETEEDNDAQEDQDTHADEDDDTLAPDEDEATEAEGSEVPKPKKNRFQERIDEVVGKQRETERKLEEALAKLQNLQQEPKPEPEPIKAVADTTTGPRPDELKEDGTEKYPLGEFDPNYIKDLTLHTLREERDNEKRLSMQAEQEKQDAQVKLEIAESWTEKLGPAKERYPDFQEKGEQLFTSFESIDQKYGEYLATTLMTLDYGPDVLYYLSNNLDEADKIIKSGPTKAVIAFGRIEAKFADAAAEKQLSKPRVSKAPAPPGHLNKGTSSAKAAIKGDEDDLDAFARELFKKKR
jgi:hypothetical protein